MNEKNKDEQIEQIEQIEVKPFNDATEHLQNIVGWPNKKADLNAMPAIIKWFYISVMVVIVIGAILFITTLIIK